MQSEQTWSHRRTIQSPNSPGGAVGPGLRPLAWCCAGVLRTGPGSSLRSQHRLMVTTDNETPGSKSKPMRNNPGALAQQQLAVRSNCGNPARCQRNNRWQLRFRRPVPPGRAGAPILRRGPIPVRRVCLVLVPNRCGGPARRPGYFKSQARFWSVRGSALLSGCGASSPLRFACAAAPLVRRSALFSVGRAWGFRASLVSLGGVVVSRACFCVLVSAAFPARFLLPPPQLTFSARRRLRRRCSLPERDSSLSEVEGFPPASFCVGNCWCC